MTLRRLLSISRARCFIAFVSCAVALLLLLALLLSDSNMNFAKHPQLHYDWQSPRLPALSEPLSFEMAQIRQAAADAWSAYARTGMVGDDLRPVHGDTVDYLHVRATLFDSLDTLYVMGLHEQFEKAVETVVALGAPRTLLHPTSSFEYNIRIVGGLLSAAQLSHNTRLLALARDAAHTLVSSAYVILLPSISYRDILCSYLLWPSALMADRVRMQPLTLSNLPCWLLARAMDGVWMVWQCARSMQGRSRLAKVATSRARDCMCRHVLLRAVVNCFLLIRAHVVDDDTLLCQCDVSAGWLIFP
jgi:hypothetical protein